MVSDNDRDEARQRYEAECEEQRAKEEIEFIMETLDAWRNCKLLLEDQQKRLVEQDSTIFRRDVYMLLQEVDSTATVEDGIAAMTMPNIAMRVGLTMITLWLNENVLMEGGVLEDGES